jgi:cell wall-associated NlpC family hydrolase
MFMEETPSGFDCSGYVQYVMGNFGIGIERVADAQSKQGALVNKGSLAPGDLVFFDTDGGLNMVNHVGIYLGGGRFIHCSSARSANRVVISDLTSGFYDTSYMTAKRVIR